MTKESEHFGKGKVEEILAELRTSEKGLNENEARTRLKTDGLNVLTQQKEVGVVLEFLSHFKDPLILILLVAAGFSATLGEVKNLVIIFVMILASVILDFFEEHSAGNAIKKLRDTVKTTSTVVRNGKKEDIQTSHICKGDIIFLSSGDLVPADARVIEADDFFVNQSSLTGESFPREKAALEESGEHSDLRTVVYHGSNVVSGTAKAVVFETGKSTSFGHIAETISKKDEKSDFEHGITKFGLFIMKVAFALVLCIFLVNAIINHNILQSFIFAIAIAVGITPEMLPVVMSVTMARGAKRMAKMGVIVKKLSAIPNFGSMDILCTDKTGTLTEDKIELVLYTDIAGNPNDDVLKYTYLNSTYQTGVRNPLDKAVLAYRKIDVSEYEKTEEIPFDFVRKMMSVAVRQRHGKEGEFLITKGAPEAVLDHCDHYEKKGRRYKMSESARKAAFAYYESLSADGYRVLALALRSNLPKKKQYTHEDENNLALLGFIAFLDPAKKDVREVLKSLHTYGVEVKVITGDNELVTQKICRDIGMDVKGVLLGKDLALLTDDALAAKAEETTIFARFSPDEKNRIITALRSRGHVVGYLGDGINDAPSLKTADIGISVNNAVDVAKETADIILTRKHLKSVIDGIIEGRKVFGNTMKYIMIALSSNFGNMFSVLGALWFLPYLPMLPVQILLNNFIYDISQVAISSDSVDPAWLEKPRKWDLNSIKKFMYVFGPISSLFDFFTFFILFSIFHLTESAFQTGWFMLSLATQVLVIHIMRTRTLPFIKSRASTFLTISTFSAFAIGWLIPYTKVGEVFSFTPLPFEVVSVLVGLTVLYFCIVEIAKRVFFKYVRFN
jgi:Mg2+-importing ATPase